MYIYLLGIIQEYLVIINAYNGNILPSYIGENIEYSLVGGVILLFSLLRFIRRMKRARTIVEDDERRQRRICRQDLKMMLLEIFLVNVVMFSHLQWYFHSPFKPWPKWWFASQGEGDIRHRTEYYDTHVMCFSIWLIMFLRFVKFI